MYSKNAFMQTDPMWDKMIDAFSTGGLIYAFLMTALLVVAAGSHLSICGDALAIRTGLENGVIGLIFLAGLTSLPELVAALTSILTTAPAVGADLALGNVLGSNAFNLLIMALLALCFSGQVSAHREIKPHLATMLHGVCMLFFFAVAYFGASVTDALVPGLQCSWSILPVPLFYLVSLRLSHQQTEDKPTVPLSTTERLAHLSPGVFYTWLIFLSLLIFAGGMALSRLGSRMALPHESGGFGLEASLIGTLFLAISTSLPELAIAFASMRLGLIDMAYGNILGSSLFNLLIIFAGDVTMRHNSLLKAAGAWHSRSIALILLLSLLATVLMRTRRIRYTIATALLMVAAYIFAIAGFV